jgi:hypothetical protein
MTRGDPLCLGLVEGRISSRSCFAIGAGQRIPRYRKMGNSALTIPESSI